MTDQQSRDRLALPNRRQCERFDIEHAGRRYAVTVGQYLDGQPGEVFLSGPKSGTDLDAMSRDAAVACSIALQFGAPASVLRDAMTRLDDGGAAGPLACALDKISEGR